ncbi:hypothetical protein KC331_g11 [Hortaea werneckii]|nr:hypothetical protein KC331_g11 [Hortaea werneckii]
MSPRLSSSAKDSHDSSKPMVAHASRLISLTQFMRQPAKQCQYLWRRIGSYTPRNYDRQLDASKQVGQLFLLFAAGDLLSPLPFSASHYPSSYSAVCVQWQQYTELSSEHRVC